MSQLVFKFPFKVKYYEQDFYVSSNNFSVYKLIESWPDWPGKWVNIFGSSGSGNFLTKATTWLAIAFFAISLVLGNLTANRVKSNDEFDNLSIQAEQTIPAEKNIPAVSAEPVNTDVPAATEAETKKSDDNDIPD